MKGGRMKRFYLIGLWAILVMGWTACGSSPGEEPVKEPSEEENPGGNQPEEEQPDKEHTFSVSPEILECRAEGETVKISIESDMEWNVEIVNMNWCSLDQDSGEGNAEVNVTVESNVSGIQREGVIRFHSLEKTVEVRLTQSPIDLQVPMTFSARGLDGYSGSVGVFVVNHSIDGDGKLVNLTDNQVNNVEAIWQDGAWAFVQPAWWKDTETIVNAYVYAPYRQMLLEDTPSTWILSVETDQAVAEPHCAYYGNVSGVSPGDEGILSVEMQPLNGCMSVQLVYDAQIYRILSVALEGVTSKATLDLNTGVVTSCGEEGRMVASLQGEEGDKTASWMLFPQQLEAGTIVQIEMMDLREGEDASVITRDLSLSEAMEVQSGKKLELKCQIEATLEKMVLEEVHITDWEPGGEFTFSFN